MHDIVVGKLSVDEARDAYAENASAHVLGRSAPYTERLQFSVSTGETGDQDEAMIAGPMAEQAVEKVKDLAR